MRREPRTTEIIDDDTTLFDVPAEWLVPDICANDWRHQLDDDGGLRALASNVTLLSRREWPGARAGRRHRDRFSRAQDWPDLPHSA
jgi:hypothetical protein